MDKDCLRFSLFDIDSNSYIECEFIDFNETLLDNWMYVFRAVIIYKSFSGIKVTKSWATECHKLEFVEEILYLDNSLNITETTKSVIDMRTFADFEVNQSNTIGVISCMYNFIKFIQERKVLHL